MIEGLATPLLLRVSSRVSHSYNAEECYYYDGKYFAGRHNDEQSIHNLYSNFCRLYCDFCMQDERSCTCFISQIISKADLIVLYKKSCHWIRN